MAFIQICLASIFLVILSASLTGSVSRQLRIFGGHHAAKNQFPFLVSIRWQEKSGEKFEHICGASILNDRFIVTAAHCKMINNEPHDYRISVGAHLKDEPVEMYEINDFITHPNFTKPIFLFEDLSHDIALIHMAEPIRLGTNATTIAIDRDFIEPNRSAIAAGWGFTDDQYTGLKYTELKTLSNDECRKLSKPDTIPIKDFQTLCAYSGTVGTGICYGDSGGPLISNKKLIGVVSWTSDCGKGFPDGFTRISEYVGWIDQVMQKLS